MSSALCNLSTDFGAAPGRDVFVTRCYRQRLSYPKARAFGFTKAVTGSKLLMGDSQPFEEDSILTALLLINGYLFFFLSAFNTGTVGGKKAIRELYRYGVTCWVPAGQCVDPRDGRTHTVAVACSLCGGETSELSISTHTG